MNIVEKTAIWTQFRFQLPMIICAIWVITSQRKIIWNTLKTWWNWGFSNWPEERINYLKIFGVGVVAFVVSSLVTKEQIKLEAECQQETVAKMLEEKIITQEDLDKEKQKEAEREREREQNDHRI